MVVVLLSIILVWAQYRKGMHSKRSDASTRVLLSLGPLSFLTSIFFVALAMTQLFMLNSGLAVIFDGLASGTFWIFAIAYVLTYFQFLAKQVRMNEESKKRFFTKYERVMNFYMPIHVLCVIGCFSITFVPIHASAQTWEVARVANISGNFIPLCVIGLYILPSSMKFSVREIETSAQLRVPSKQRVSQAGAGPGDSNDSQTVKNTNSIQRLLVKMKIARVVILITAATQFFLVLLVIAVSGFRFVGGVQNAISFGCVGLLIIFQFLVLLNHLEPSSLCCALRLGRAGVPQSTALSPKKSVSDVSNEKSVTSGVRPASITPKDMQQ